MNLNQTLEQIRPTVEPVDATWSARTLHDITRAPAPRPRHRRLRIAAVSTVALLGTGGVAYAAGVVPAFVTQQLDWISPSDVRHERRVASFSVPTEEADRTFEIWRGENRAGQTCTVVHEADGRFGPTFDGACAEDPARAWFGWTAESSKVNEPMPAATLYVYGEPGDSHVRQVRVEAAGFTRTAEVDRTSGGYAVAIPEVTSDSWTERAGQVVATVDFLDAKGLTLSSHIVRDR